MTNYYKYLPVSQQDENWGLHVLDAGCSRILPGQQYPSPDHPSHHYFNWAGGRVMREYQLVYITKGSGYFESTHCKEKKIIEGTVFMLFPDEWHRFKPDPETGWDEFWVGFEGSIIKDIIQNHFFSPPDPVLSIGMQDSILGIFTAIIDATKKEKAGYQPYISGAVLHLVGNVYTLVKQQSIFTDDLSEQIISKAKLLLRAGINDKISIEELAGELQVSYSWFRKTFKANTGMAPGQYLLQLRVEQAKLLLADHSRSIKSIADELNFESSFYFSSLFKTKIGVSPAQYRKKFTREKTG